MNKKQFLTGIAASLVGAPAVVQAANIMRVRGIRALPIRLVYPTVCRHFLSPYRPVARPRVVHARDRF